MITAPLPKFDYPRKKWTVADCRFLQENGLLEGGRYELIEGDIVFKMAQGNPHKTAVSLTLIELIRIFAGDTLRSQADIGVGQSDKYNEPEPDIAILRGAARDYTAKNPSPEEDVLLAFEASVSSLSGDLTVKAGIYARQKIREYWVLDVEGRRLHVFRAPMGGDYATHDVLSDADSVSPLAAPGATVRVADLLP